MKSEATGTAVMDGMSLGTIRFILALMVVLNHLWLPTSDRVGAHAVIAFYIISGFLMTKLVNEVYVGEWGGGEIFA